MRKQKCLYIVSLCNCVRVVGLQVYVMWLHLILNTLVPLAILLTLNYLVYARLSNTDLVSFLLRIPIS